MSAAALWPMFLFAVAASVSPGPNNILAMSAAARHGFRRTIPFGLGVVAGFFLMVCVVGIGLAVPLQRYPALVGVMRWIGAIWLLVLAWRIGTAPGDAASADRPAMGFAGAAGFQGSTRRPGSWQSPPPPRSALPGSVRWAAACCAPPFAGVGVASITSWMLLGLGAGRLLATPVGLRWFNRAMGVLLALSVVPAVLE